MSKPGKTVVITTTNKYWGEALTTGTYAQSSIGSTLEEVGFIHCSFPDQVLETANRKFKEHDDLVFLFVDTEKLHAPVKYEGALSGRSGTFPHIYGPLNTDAVYATAAVEKDDRGQFVAPGELIKARKSQ